jgi:hypothetical protein
MTRIWVPAALGRQTPFQKTLSNTFTAEGGNAKIVESKTDALGTIAAEFPAGVKPILTVTSRIATKNYSVDLSVPSGAQKGDRSELEHFLRPTKLIPTDGIVNATAIEITKHAKTDVEKARFYEWIVDNTFRNPKTRGCGVGDIRFMLESRDLAANAPISMRSILASRVGPAFPRATCTGSVSPSRRWDTRASVPRRRK